MLKTFVCIFILCMALILKVNAQNDELIIRKSLSYFDKKFNLNMKKMNEPVMVSFNNNDYLCTDYVDTDSLSSLVKVRFFLKLYRVKGCEFEFNFNIVYDFKGSFELIEENGNYYFWNFSYVKTIE